jgi:hypothetical protein
MTGFSSEVLQLLLFVIISGFAAFVCLVAANSCYRFWLFLLPGHAQLTGTDSVREVNHQAQENGVAQPVTHEKYRTTSSNVVLVEGEVRV